MCILTGFVMCETSEICSRLEGASTEINLPGEESFHSPRKTPEVSLTSSICRMFPSTSSSNSDHNLHASKSPKECSTPPLTPDISPTGSLVETTFWRTPTPDVSSSHLEDRDKSDVSSSHSEDHYKSEDWSSEMSQISLSTYYFSCKSFVSVSLVESVIIVCFIFFPFQKSQEIDSYNSEMDVEDSGSRVLKMWILNSVSCISFCFLLL